MDRKLVIDLTEDESEDEWMQYLHRPVVKAKLTISKGGPGSGHRGHKGIPGHQGGSLPDGASAGEKPTKGFNISNAKVGEALIAPYGVRYTIDEINIQDTAENTYMLVTRPEEVGKKFVYQRDATNWRYPEDNIDYEDMQDTSTAGFRSEDENDPEFWMYYDENGEGFDLREGAETNWVDRYEDVKASKFGKGYIISGDDRIADISNEFGGGSNDHPGFVAMSADRETFGLTNREARDFLAGYMDGDPDRMAIGWNKFFDSGAIRVREFKDQIVIESKKVDKPTLRRLQRLYDEGKFGITERKYVTWEASADYGVGVVSFGYEDFLDAKFVDTKNGVLKEAKTAKLRLKGGAGSGFHGHAGRPGEVGGSVAEGAILPALGHKPATAGSVTSQEPSTASQEEHRYKTPQELAKHLKANLGDLKKDLLKIQSRYGSTMYGVGLTFTMAADPEELKTKITGILSGTDFGIDHIVVNDIATINGQSTDVIYVDITANARIIGGGKIEYYKGGEGSGHFGHAGIPGHQGGSLPEGVSSSETAEDYVLKRDYSDDPANFVGRHSKIAYEFEQAAAVSLQELQKLKRKYTKLADEQWMPGVSEDIPSPGAVAFFYKVNADWLKANYGPARSAADARADRILHITNSEGKRTARRR